MTDPTTPLDAHDPPEFPETAPALPRDPEPEPVYHEDETDVADEPQPRGFLARVAGLLSRVSAPPVFIPPFDCARDQGIGAYRGTTYPGHSDYSVDLNGIDGSDIGDPVLASIGGTVTLIIASNGQIHTRDSAGWGAIYAHCQAITVRKGDKVKQGQQIAELGNAGIGSTGPHLHVNHLKGSDRIQVSFDGVPYSASVKPNTAYRSGRLVEGHCAEVPEDPMPSIVLARDFDLTLPSGTVVKVDPVSSAKALPYAPTAVYQYGVVEGQPWRAVAVDATDGKRRIGYVPSNVGTTVAKVPTGCTPGQLAAARTEGRTDMKAEAVAASNGLVV